MKRYKVGLIITIALVLIFGLASSYAFFIYKGEGNNITLNSGDISLNFTSEVEDISIHDARPTSDGLGKIYPYYVDFDIDGTVIDEGIKYQIQLVPTANTTIDLSYIKGYLTDQENNMIKDVFSYMDLRDINDTTGKDGKVIYTEYFTSSETHHYRLRIWINDEYTSEIGEKFGFKVYLYAENGEQINVMGTIFNSGKLSGISTSNVSEIHFVNDTKENIETRYEAAPIKGNLTNTNHNVGTVELQEMENYGHVYGWAEVDENKANYYKLYIASTGPVYLSTGNGLFRYIYSSPIIDFSGASTKYVTDMSSMFQSYQGNNGELDLSNFDTSNVTDMSYMFYSAMKLKKINFSGWDTSNVETMNSMFESAQCENGITLELIGIDDWNTESLNSAYYMFGSFAMNSNINCTIDLHKWNVSNLKDAHSMFYYAFIGCQNININVSHWDLTNITRCESMFNSFGGGGDEVNLDISYWKFPSTYSNMFTSYSGMIVNYTINASHIDFSDLTTLSKLFLIDAVNITINLDYSDVSTITNMKSLFEGAGGSYASNVTISFKGLNTSNVTNMSYMFSNAFDGVQNLQLIDFDKLNTSHVTDMSYMFDNIGYSNNNYYNDNRQSIFNDSHTPLTIDLSGWDTSSVTNMSNMFSGIIETIYVGNNWNVSNVTNSTDMFEKTNNISLIKGGNGTTFDSNHTDKSYAHVDTAGNPGYLTLKTN